MTPALVVDGVVKFAGKLPRLEEIKSRLTREHLSMQVATEVM
jgi:hypothetical protein